MLIFTGVLVLEIECEKKTFERMVRRFYEGIPRVYNSSHHKILIYSSEPQNITTK
jgi:hypothetical protein